MLQRDGREEFIFGAWMGRGVGVQLPDRSWSWLGSCNGFTRSWLAGWVAASYSVLGGWNHSTAQAFTTSFALRAGCVLASESESPGAKAWDWTAHHVP